MKQGAFSLNPYAAAYIPLSKREADDRTYERKRDSMTNDGTVWYGSSQHIPQDRHIRSCNTHATEKLPISSFSVRNYPDSGPYGSSSQSMNEVTNKQMLDEESDMELEYLRMSFPSISDQSLTDVYMVNKGDLEATVEMLSQLEFDTFEFSGSLPETLDIGDVSESGSSADYAPLKLKNVAAEASTSSSSLKPANFSGTTL
ncbi:polyadenylate-binding protein-interacting protein 5-like [Quillaja saponaria]|uniref:Polyadenylate-binding protein-interacting protein 5-like n=1 Tax=Quillaja saponaria TaxID=32244 RepID=A0AAD7LJZ9_QUISA|nr:polyadenylate-binding protein-interacting protein 5-like [Quillaja saponaria]